MAWNQNIPQPTDQLSTSQADILNNFIAIQSLVDVNHVDFNAGANQGKHFFVELPTQNPVPTTVGGEVGLYSQVSTLTSQPELVFSHQAGSTAPAPAQIVEFTSAGWSAIGWTRLPSGILLKWGNASANGLTTYTFPSGATIPAFNTIYSIQITTAYVNTGDSPNGFVRLNNFIAPWTQFTVYGSPRTTSGSLAVAYQYLAIGI